MRIAILAAVMAVTGFSSAALAEGKKIGVSWAQFQEERWKIDEAAMKAAIEAAGNEYVSADAQSSAEKQLSDIDALIAQGVDALIINAWDKDAIGPAIEKAAAEGIPVVGYDRLIEDNRTFYLTFDNVGVGRIIAENVFAAAPKGNYAIIKGDPGDPNVGFLRQGMEEVIGAAVASGDIVIVGEANSDGWKPENADGKFGGPMTLREALAELERTGDRVRRPFSRELGEDTQGAREFLLAEPREMARHVEGVAPAANRFT